MTDILHRVGEALLMAFGMFWQVGWSLVLGFAVSAVLQAIVSKETRKSDIYPNEQPCPESRKPAIAHQLCIRRAKLRISPKARFTCDGAGQERWFWCKLL